ncbi:spermidine synthase [Streptomyces sp. PTM05]|uniref:Spermidine synthase n=1 Tax=Streptantibioticus parmotrematis TaxID=2873249 RepID=A0ABS7QY77_9ACTN|nr:spermidine synthase [Streptantibioticus parmotrematis]MBY8888172.1 spermidine synthase [Streptantibioticus parmotrematis]
MPDVIEPAAETVERREGPYGEVVLRRRGGHFEIIANGCFLMDTSDGRSERLLIRAALDALTGGAATDPAQTDPASTGPTSAGGDRPEPVGGPSVLIGGLGVGFSLAEAAAEPRWGRITVVERERAVVDWHRDGPLAPFSAGALDDPRVDVVERDLLDHLRGAHGAHDALCLDIDNGPDWTVTESNDSLYSPGGLAGCLRALAPEGVLAVWSARPSTRFEDALRAAGFAEVQTIPVPVARGVPDAVHLARRPSGPT